MMPDGPGGPVARDHNRSAPAPHSPMWPRHNPPISPMCSPSLAAFLTGTTPQVNHVFDQMEHLFTGLGTQGHGLPSLLFRQVRNGRDALQDKPAVIYSKAAQPLGFEVFNATGGSAAPSRPGSTLTAHRRRGGPISAHDRGKSAQRRQAILRGSEFRQSARHHIAAQNCTRAGCCSIAAWRAAWHAPCFVQ